MEDLNLPELRARERDKAGLIGGRGGEHEMELKDKEDG